MMTLNNNKRNDRLAMLEQRLSTVTSEDRRRHIEERLTNHLRSTTVVAGAKKNKTTTAASLLSDNRIAVFEDRLARLDHLRQRQASRHGLRKEKRQMSHEKRCFAIPQEGCCLAADDPKNAVDAVTRKKVEKARQKNLQAHMVKSLTGRIQKLQAKLALDDNPHREDLEARLAKLRDQKKSNHQHDRSPHHLAARIKWMEHRVEQNPNHPELRARLDHLLTKVPMGVVVQMTTTATTKGSTRNHRLDRLEARIRVQEKRLKNSPDGQNNRVELELKLSKQYDLKEKLMRRQLQQEQLDHHRQPPPCRRREKPAVLLLQRIRKLERLLNSLDNAEERLALEDRLDRLRHNLGRHDAAGPASANDEGEDTMEIVEQVKNMKLT
jgi:hypothetical protein